MENEAWSELSVLQAAHAAEILIKARIAEEHPLLIFETLPKPQANGETLLTFPQLAEKGRTYQFSDLPDRLWAATGIAIPNIEIFKSFGRLRNTIQHFAPPEGIDLSQETVEFIFNVIDPFIYNCWGLCAIDYNEDHELYEYFVPGIIRRRVLFHVSKESIAGMNYMDLEWPEGPDYRREMERRFAAILGQQEKK